MCSLTIQCSAVYTDTYEKMKYYIEREEEARGMYVCTIHTLIMH